MRESKNAPSISDEAMKMAKAYDSLDDWAQTAVRGLMKVEMQRCKDDARFAEGTAEFYGTPEPRVINLFLVPSAVGLAAPIAGKDYEPYDLKPDEPQDAAYAIRVQGNSMEPGFPDDSTVFVNHDIIANGDIGVFCINGSTVVRQYYHDPMGMTYLFALNRRCADADILIYPSSNRTVVCQGRVITAQRYPLPKLGER